MGKSFSKSKKSVSNDAYMAVIDDNASAFSSVIESGYGFRFFEMSLMIQRRAMKVIQFCDDHFKLVKEGVCDSEIDMTPEQIRQIMILAKSDKEIYSIIKEWVCEENYQAYQNGEAENMGPLKRWEDF